MAATRGENAPPEAPLAPGTYKGIAAFHRYWGKKPADYVDFLIRTVTDPGDLVVDPMSGAGLSGPAAVRHGRRFVGIDLNPVAAELGRLFLVPPPVEELTSAFQRLSETTRPRIEESYALGSGEVASHYLWEQDSLRAVWSRPPDSRSRVEHEPTHHDLALSATYRNYAPQHPKPLRLFANGRINAHEDLALNDLFTGRALRNIDLLLEDFEATATSVRRALRLALTAASGQMSNMVFAITGRGKRNGSASNRIEVGSWVIGYWRPPLHFEVNAWNTFATRGRRLTTALSSAQLPTAALTEDVSAVVSGRAEAAVLVGDATTELAALPDQSVRLVVADPPHTDRIPYLELSAMWNSLLGLDPAYASEMVVSNARDRDKTLDRYATDLLRFFKEASRIMRPDGCLALYFNSADPKEWTALRTALDGVAALTYQGTAPVSYSARSVVQDNRAGALKEDHLLFFGSAFPEPGGLSERLRELPGWKGSSESAEFPVAV